MAKYPYIVKCNGVWYDAGEEVPETEDMEVGENPPPYSDYDIDFETKEDKTYTKSDINRMNTEELQNLAAKVGIENAYETSGNKLKGIIAEHFGL